MGGSRATVYQYFPDKAEMHDRYAVVFLELPGIGTIDGTPANQQGTVAEQHEAMVGMKLRDSGVQGLAPADAAGALIRIVHMVIRRLEGG